MTSKFARQAKWRERNPEKVWAHAALKSALRRGLVNPQPCAVCGDHKAEGHHYDYSRPANVVWLCRKHHKAVHQRMKCEAANG